MDTVLPSVSVAELASTLGTPRAPLVLDVRRPPAFEQDDSLVAGALRAPPDTLPQWLAVVPSGRPIVVYCVHGHEVSQGAARSLAAAGRDARILAGGIAAWRESGHPTVRRRPDLGMPASPGTPGRWVTRERPKIDRIACPWLVRRFIDPTAEFLYVPAGKVAEVAADAKAIAYDVPGVLFAHRGENCSFDAFIAEFGLRDPALDELARIVRAADTGRPEDSPVAPGLLAVSLGLSALHADDHRMLEQGMGVYDALYAWIRSARAEVHNADRFKAAR